MRKHAALSPSSAARWINCPGSVRISALCPEPPSSPYADEGTVAHALAELKLRSIDQGDNLTRRQHAEWRAIHEDMAFCGEMDEATDFYVQIVTEHMAAAGPDAVMLIEQRFSLEDWIPECFGTSDAVVISGDTIEVFDFKYGKGVKVDARENPQMRLYGLGAATLFSALYDFKTVRMTIIQPRLDHVSTEELPLEDLLSWALETVKPAAQEALDPAVIPRTSCGDWCRFCPAKATCRTRAEANLDIARYEFRKPDLLTSDEVAEILGRIDELTRWATDVSDYALQQALEGEHFTGWKLVEGRSVRKYADDLKVAEKLQAAGFPEAALYERKLLGLTAMEKLVGKKKLTETLGDLIVKPAGKPVLAPESDKRPAINTTEAAKADFEPIPFN